MKIVLIETEGGQKHGYSSGFGYLSSSLKKNNFDVLIFDLNVLNISREELFGKIKEFSPKIIGISMKSAQYITGKKIASELKNLLQESIIVAGGPHITIEGEKFIQKNPEFDFAFSGESEISFSNFSKDISEITSFSRAELIYTFLSNKGRNQRVFYPENIISLDDLPFPDFSSFYNLNLSDYPYQLLTSRGCPFNCIYCSVSTICGKKWRYRTPENILEEIKNIIKKNAIQSIDINDDNFTLDINRAKKICELMIKNNLKIKWQCHNGIRAKNLDPELAKLMKKAGCWSVALGIETGNEESFHNIGKGEILDDIRTAIKYLRKAKIRVGGYFIIGLPKEKYSDIKATIEFQKSLELDFFTFGILVPYPGTKTYDIIKENGKFLSNYWEAKHFGINIKPVFETDDLSSKEMSDVYILANLGDIKDFAETINKIAEKRKIKISNIAIIRSLLADNLAEKIKENYQNARIDLISDKEDKFEFKYDGIIKLNKADIKNLLRALLVLRKNKYDLILFIAPEKNGFLLFKIKMFSFLSGAKIKLYIDHKREIKKNSII